MKRRTGDRNLSTDDLSVKRIVRHKEHHNSPSPESILNQDTRKRSVTQREIHSHSFSGTSGGGGTYNKYTNPSKYSHTHSQGRRNSPERSASLDRHRHTPHHQQFTDNPPIRHTKYHSHFHDRVHVTGGGSNNIIDQIDFSLHISNLDTRVSEDDLRKGLFKEYKRYGYVNVKILGYGKDRKAFVNYQHYDEARRARKETQNFMLFNRPIHVEWSRTTLLKYPEVASGKRHSTNSTPDVQQQQQPSYYDDYSTNEVAGGAVSTRNHHERISSSDHKRDVSYRTNPTSTRTGSNSVEAKQVVPVIDPNATRTLFVGNLELDVTERELRDLFSQYGRIESVDIKLAKSAGTTYAFVKFTTITDAINAKDDMHGRMYGNTKLKIGFGKGSPTGKVWVGNLTTARDMAEVRHEMDRFGLIRRCDYRDGDGHAYVHFESLEAAQAAVQAMIGFRLRNGRSIKMDIHKPLFLREAEENATEFHTPRRDKQDTEEFSSNHRQHHTGNRDVDTAFVPRKLSNDYSRGTKERVVNDNSRNEDRTFRKRPRTTEDVRQVSHHDHDFNGDLTSHSKRRAMGYNSGHKNSKGYQHRSPERSRSKREDREKPSSAKRTSEKDKESGHVESSSKDKKEKEGNGHKINSDSTFQALTAEPSANTMMMESDTALKLTDSTEPVSPESDGKGSKPDSPHSESLTELAKVYPVAWLGNLVLKNTGFPARMHLIGGDPSVAESLLRCKDGQSALRITQRLRLEQPRLEEVDKRISMAGPSGHCILFALPGSTVNQNSPDNSQNAMQLRPLRSLVSYLKQKEAAGIVALSAADFGEVGDSKDPKEVVGVLHAFPPCEFSHSQLLKIVPSLGPEPSKEDHIVVLLVKGNV